MYKYYVILVALLWSCDNPEPAKSIDESLADITAEELKNHMSILSSDDLLGRYPGAAGYDSAASYVEKQVREMGLLPGGNDGGYRQRIEFNRAEVKPDAITAKLNGELLEYGTDFIMSATQEDVSFSGDVVFAGSGVHAPDQGFSDLENLDVDGKVVMYIWRTTPNSFGSIERAVHINLMRKRLRERGAIGFISVVSPETLKKWPWPLMKWLMGRPQMNYIAEEDVPYRDGIVISYKTAAAWLERDGKKFSEILKNLKDGMSTSFETSLNLEVEATSNRVNLYSDNVAAIKEGSDPKLKEEYLVITAHLDHDGISSPVENDSIYNGTIDNASGSAALLVLADKIAKMETKRSVMFLWVTAEERGLLGSEYFAKWPTIDKSKIVANQNMDGIVNLIADAKDVVAYGYEHSNLSLSADYAIEKMGLKRSEDKRPEETFFVRSDQYSFVAEGIPAIWMIGGYEGVVDSVDTGAILDEWLVTRYHRPNDDMEQPLNFESATKELKYNLLIAYHIANELEEVKWNKDGFLYRTFVEGSDQ